ncbi:MAG: hypothetical protein H6827_10850 [Planctomycetes bacterium]|nr:hypothetical protein [Planctomycetota bacterium]
MKTFDFLEFDLGKTKEEGFNPADMVSSALHKILSLDLDAEAVYETIMNGMRGKKDVQLLYSLLLKKLIASNFHEKLVSQVIDKHLEYFKEFDFGAYLGLLFDKYASTRDPEVICILKQEASSNQNSEFQSKAVRLLYVIEREYSP